MARTDISTSRYSPEWFAKFQDNTIASARVVVPLVIDLVAPASVVDVGCGTGGWLAVFAANGVSDISGIDGPWVSVENLLIPKDRFMAVDLDKPFTFNKKADLVTCLEVAEHISADSASAVVKNLINIAPVVLFSAAIPHQGGNGHVNEQWPSYWAAIFSERGYVPVDCLRRKVWNDDRVSYWYAQNMVIFVKESELHNYAKLAQEVASGNGSAAHLVHPKKYLSLFASKPSLRKRAIRKVGRLMGR